MNPPFKGVLGEHKVEHHEIGFFGIEIFDEAGSVREFPHAEMVLIEIKRNQLQKVLFVIDDSYDLMHMALLRFEPKSLFLKLFHFTL